MKIFDWEKAKHREDFIKLLKDNHKKVISEDEWFVMVKSLNNTRRSPSSIGHNYRKLKENFGFFQ